MGFGIKYFRSYIIVGMRVTFPLTLSSGNFISTASRSLEMNATLLEIDVTRESLAEEAEQIMESLPNFSTYMMENGVICRLQFNS